MDNQTNQSKENVKLNRRDALRNAIQGTVVAAMVAPSIATAAQPESTPVSEADFIPENDYPFFGCELPSKS